MWCVEVFVPITVQSENVQKSTQIWHFLKNAWIRALRERGRREEKKEEEGEKRKGVDTHTRVLLRAIATKSSGDVPSWHGTNFRAAPSHPFRIASHTPNSSSRAEALDVFSYAAPWSFSSGAARGHTSACAPSRPHSEGTCRVRAARTCGRTTARGRTAGSSCAGCLCDSRSCAKFAWCN